MGPLTALSVWLAASLPLLGEGAVGELSRDVQQLSELLDAAVGRAVLRNLPTWPQAVDTARLGLRLEQLEAAHRRPEPTVLVQLLIDLNTTLGILTDHQDTRALVQLLRDINATLATLADHTLRSAGVEVAPNQHQQDLEPSVCELNPSPVISTAERTTLPACARTCLQLRNQGGQHEDGVYWLSGMDVPVYCDFSHDEGGWTLLLTTASKEGWDILKVLERNPQKPSLNDNYSILRRADYIKDQGRTRRFAYRIEGQAETGRQRWGGIWLAPGHYTFTSTRPNQTEVTLGRRFDDWTYGRDSLKARMPWLRDEVTEKQYILTTSTEKNHLWGTLVTNAEGGDSWRFSPWLHGTPASHSGRILYWLREEEL